MMRAMDGEAQGLSRMPRRFAHRASTFMHLLVRAILRHSVVDLGAQLAYWSLLALFPFAIFLLTVIGYLPLGNADQQLIAWLSPFMPESALTLVWDTVHEVVGKQRGGLLTISFLGAVWSAAGGASALQTAINRAYGVEETRTYVRRKGQALLTTLGAVVLLIVAVAGATIGPDLIHKIVDYFGLGGIWKVLEGIWGWVRWPLVLTALIALLAAAYNYLPNVRHGYGLVSMGSVVAVVTWLIVSWGFRAFVSMFGSYARTYGALAAVIVLLTWFYLSGITVILGAEVNATLARVRAEEKDGDPVT
jgi:membrane protein